MKGMIQITCVTILLLLITSCNRQGSVENAGERMDEIVDNVKEGENPLKKKGAGEKLGEAIDESIDGDE